MVMWKKVLILASIIAMALISPVTGVDLGTGSDAAAISKVAMIQLPKSSLLRIEAKLLTRSLEKMSPLHPEFSFQGQCTIHDDCGTWRCCNTSCEDVTVCP